MIFGKMHQLTLSIAVVLLGVADAQDRGVVFIGNSTTGLATEYTFDFTDVGSTQFLPIYAAVFSGGNPSVTVPKTEDITIYCTILNGGQGYARVLIDNLTLPVADDAALLSLEPQANGRAVSVQCAAESVSGTCPISPGGAQFCPQTSRSNIVSMTVKPPASITHCELEVYVTASSSSFVVRLSETAKTEVTVTCTDQQQGSNPFLELTFTSLTIATGNIEGNVRFTVTNSPDDSRAEVRCVALSVSGNQYTTSSSQVDASTAVFIYKPNSLNLQPEFMKVYNTTFMSYLVLADSLGTLEVSVACRAYTYLSIEAAMQDYGTDPDCSVINNPLAAPTSPWRVKNVFFDLTSTRADVQSYFEPVTTERIQPVTVARSEVVLTRCCVRNAGASFVDLHASMVAVAELAPFICERCNTTVEDPRLERVLQNPGYVEVAPCACDLTENACDFNCCCDEGCSSNEVARFSGCIPGLLGGEPAESEEYRCSSDAFDRPDWHLMTCVYYENNAYLGQYYMNRARVAETTFTEAASSTYKGRFSFNAPESSQGSLARPYSYGVSLTTVRQAVSAGPRTSGTLALPHPGPVGGACNLHSPVRFLVDQEASCTVTLNPEMCTSLSGFSGRIYVVSSAITGCSQSFKVASVLGGSTVAATDVRYYCATDLSPYLPAASTALNDFSPTVASRFGNDLANENCSTPCSVSSCLNYNIGRTPASDPALPDLCSWDDGTTPPPVPNLNNDVCENVVLDVRYKFEWSGSTITRVMADVVLGNVANVAPGITVTQRFETAWVYKTNGSVYSLSDNFESTSEAYQRSGTAGYDDGAPLLSGCPEYNQTTQQFLEVSTGSERQMAVWKPGVDGLCVNAARQSLTFADDTYSSCALRLTADDLDSGCADLRQTVFNHLNVLMPSSVLGRYGYNNAQDLTMWIPVIRQTLNETEENLYIAENDTESFRTWADSITGACRLPTSINLNVMYAQTGAVNGYPRHEVVGSYISYTESTWSMDCQGGQAARCDPASGITQNFFLSSSVQFTKVDTTFQSSETRFHTRCDPYNFAGSSSCERFFSNVYRDECYWETCWQELAFPVEPAADRGPEYNWRLQALPVFLALVLGIVGYASVAKPGWS